MSNRANDSGWVAAAIIATSFVLILAVLGFAFSIAKYQCEKTLPSNVYCVWAAPQEQDK